MEHLVEFIGPLLSAIVVGGGAYLVLGRNVLTRKEHMDICSRQESKINRQLEVLNKKLDEHKDVTGEQFREVKKAISEGNEKIYRLMERMIDGGK